MAASKRFVYATSSQDFLYQDPNRNVIFLDNQSGYELRALSMVKEDVTNDGTSRHFAMLLTLRGIPQMYYGDEILMKKLFVNPDGLVRWRDFSGRLGWVDKDNKFVASGRSDKENDFFNYVKTLANYRKNTPALQTGKMMQYTPQHNMYVYFSVR